jgi:hypothetical protein
MASIASIERVAALMPDDRVNRRRGDWHLVPAESDPSSSVRTPLFRVIPAQAEVQSE